MNCRGRPARYRPNSDGSRSCVILHQSAAQERLSDGAGLGAGAVSHGAAAAPRPPRRHHADLAHRRAGGRWRAGVPPQQRGLVCVVNLSTRPVELPDAEVLRTSRPPSAAAARPLEPHAAAWLFAEGRQRRSADAI
ncbi:DUF3459 domain-containing protein [Streptomyces sp. NPDC003233]